MKPTRTKAFGALAVLFLCAASVTANAPEIPEVSANLGSCKADFAVKDGAGKPLYDAKINVVIRYGFFSLRKLELEVGTNSDGKARVTGLPDSTKKPLEFVVKSGTVSHSVTDDVSATCIASYDVTLSVR